MSLSRKIFYNTVIQSVGKAGSVALGLVTIGLLTRFLQETGFGQYSTILAFLGVFVVFADLGLYLIVTREISKNETDHCKIISNALGLRLFTAALVLIAGALIALIFPYDPIVKQAMFIGIGAFLFVSLNQVLIGIFQKHLVQYWVISSELVGRAINLFLVYLFIQRSLGLPYFILALLLGNGINFFLTFIFARRYEKFTIQFDFTYWKKILKSSWPLAFAVILNLLYFKTDTIILSAFDTQEAVGVYSLPYKILEVLLAFPAMFVGLVMPLLSRTAFGAWDEFKKIMQRSFDALLLLAIPVIITTWFFAQEIIDLIKGPEQSYIDSPALLQILIIATGIIFLGTLFGYAVVAVDQQKPMIWGYLAGAIIGLILYFSLIPRFSYFGAAIGTLITEAVVASVAYFLVKKTSGQGISLKIFVKAVPALLVLILFFKFISLPWIVEAIVGLIIYGILLLLFRAIPVQFIKEIAFRNKQI